MSEVTLYQALQVAESNLRIGYSPGHAIAKATDLLQVNPFELAVLLLDKVTACAKAREERILLAAYDKLIDAGPATSDAGVLTKRRYTSRGRRAAHPTGEQHG